MAGYTLEERQAAVQADLFLFIKYHFPDSVKQEGNSLRLKEDHSVSIKRGYSGAYDFSCGKGYSGIDVLMVYFGYSLTDAIKALAEFDGYTDLYSVKADARKENSFVIPEKSPTTYRVRRYLQGRGIDSRVIDWLIARGLLFEDERHNCCFLNNDMDYLEKRGTWEPPIGSDKEPFKQVRKKKSDNYWSFGVESGRCYITESAIDAISLYQLKRERACYVSLGGVANYQTIERLAGEFGEVWLAVDADDAGLRCRQRFADLPSIVPDGVKDWNELLKKKVKAD